MTNEYSFEHHGIKGQRWGVRRYQNADGSLTDAGKRKYSKDLEKAEYKKYQEAYYNREKYSTKQLNEMNNRMNAEMNFRRNLNNAKPKNAGAELGKEWGRRLATAIALLAVSEGSRYIYSKGKEGGFALIRDITQSDEGGTGMNELHSFEHHGIKGQRWGVRRYQNADGSLTAKGRKHYTKKFKKYMDRGDRDLSRAQGDLYAESYNRAADKMNNGIIEAYNKAKEKRYGENFADRPDYISDYEKVWNKQLQNELTKSLLHFASQNKNYQKAYDLNKKYGLDKSDPSLKSQTDALNDAMKNRKG